MGNRWHGWHAAKQAGTHKVPHVCKIGIIREGNMWVERKYVSTKGMCGSLGRAGTGNGELQKAQVRQGRRQAGRGRWGLNGGTCSGTCWVGTGRQGTEPAQQGKKVEVVVQQGPGQAGKGRQGMYKGTGKQPRCGPEL